MAPTMRISHIERIYVRWVTIDCYRRDKPVTRKEYEVAIMMANNRDPTSVTVDKLDAAKNTRKHCYPRPKNPYFFIPYGFKIHFAKLLLSKDTVKLFKDFVGNIENDGNECNIRETPGKIKCANVVPKQRYGINEGFDSFATMRTEEFSSWGRKEEGSNYST